MIVLDLFSLYVLIVIVFYLLLITYAFSFSKIEPWSNGHAEIQEEDN